MAVDLIPSKGSPGQHKATSQAFFTSAAHEENAKKNAE